MSSLVGYSIRLESNTSKNTRLAFVTNGIALRMLEGGTGQGGHGTAFDEITVSRAFDQSRPTLMTFQHIIIDEVGDLAFKTPADLMLYIKVHERTIESDFLLIVLKSLLAIRSDLK